MAAASKVLISGRNKYVVNVTGVFAAADETDTIIIDKSTLAGPSGAEPSKIRVDEVTWSVGAGFDYVLIEWDRATDVVVDYFQGQGCMDYRPFGGKNDTGTGGTGDLVLTTSGGAAGDSYSFLISCRLKD